MANSNPFITHRIYGGIGVLNIRDNVKLAQIGYYKSFLYNPLVLGIESSIYANSKKYNWPDVGDYKYQRLINVATFNLGFQIAKRRKLNPFLGLCYNYTLYQGKLITDNELLKEYLINDYKFEKKNIFFLIRLNYLITPKLGAYLTFNATRIKKDLAGQAFTSFGLTYNFYNKK